MREFDELYQKIHKFYKASSPEFFLPLRGAQVDANPLITKHNQRRWKAAVRRAEHAGV